MINSIAKSELIRLFSIPSAPSFWRQPAVQAARLQGGLYDCHLINEMLKNCEHNLPQPLTVADLQNGKVTLVVSTKACAELGISQQRTNEKCRKGQLQYIQLPGVYGRRIVLQSVVLLKKRARTDSPSNSKIVAHILSNTTHWVNKLVRRGALKAIPNSRPTAITYKSLHDYLVQNLPHWLTPEEWIEERLATDEPLMSFAEVARQLGGKERVLAAMQDGLLRYIGVPNNDRFARKFAPASVAEFLVGDEQVSRAMMAALFDVSEQSLKDWQACPVHTHRPYKLLRKSCILALIGQGLLNVTPEAWFNKQLAKKQPLVSCSTGAEYLGIAEKTLTALAYDRKISHVRLPTGEIRFTQNQLKGYKQNHLAKR